MKIYARQIAPEYQESPLFIDGMFPDNIAVYGNRYYKEHRPGFFNQVEIVLEQGVLADILENEKGWANFYSDGTEAIMEYLPPLNNVSYNTKDISALRSLVIDYSCCVCSREKEILCKVISVMDGRKWDWMTIRGSAQRDWQYAFYPVDEWNWEDLKTFEVEYFNGGTEWIVDDEGFNPLIDDPSDIGGCSIYCTSWGEDGIRQEIAEAVGGKPDDVVLYAFDGWDRRERYVREGGGENDYI